MQARQAGIPMQVMMEGIEKNYKQDKNVIQTLTISAYEIPRYDDKTMQKKAINDFTDQAYLTCIKI